MIYAEWKKLMHNGAFRIFLCLFLVAGALSPLFTGLDRTTPQVYEAYEGMTTEEVLADIELRQRNLEIVRTLELNAMLPPEIAEMMLDGLVDQYGLTMEDMEAIDPATQFRFTDDAFSESELLNTLKTQAERAVVYSNYLQSIKEQKQTIQNSILYRNNPYALTLARKTAKEYACLTAMYCFLQERQEGMIPLLFSTKRGRRTTFLAKLSLISVIGAVSCILFSLFTWNMPETLVI